MMIRPKLVDHVVIEAGPQIVVEAKGARARPVSLPASRKAILELLDGRMSVKDIVEYQMGTQGRVSFRALFSTLQTLEEAGLLAEPLGLGGKVSTALAPSARPEAFFLHPLFEVRLLGNLTLPELGPFARFGLLLAAAVPIIAIALDTVYYWLTHFSTRGFLWLPPLAGAAHGPSSYANAIPWLMVMASGLLCFKGLAKAVLMLAAANRVHDVKLRVHPFGLSVGVSDIALHALGRTPLVVNFLATALLYIFVAAILPDYVHNAAIIRTFETLAVLLTFIDLDAYRKSDLTTLIDRFFRDGDSRRMKAYLKNRALLSVASGSSFGGELRLVTYSTLALLWTVGFALFALDLLSGNYPNLVLTAQGTGSLVERVSAVAVLAILVGVFATLFFDLASTIVSNVVFPVLTPYLRLLQSVGTKEVADFDREAMAARLKALSFFDQLGETALKDVVASARVKNIKSGTRLIIQGDTGRELFVLLKGQVDVLKRDETGLQTRICQLAEGSVFGEIALIKDCQRTADVVAAGDIEVLIIEREKFRALLGGDLERILDRIALGHFLSSVSVFRGMPAESLGIFRELGRFQHPKAGDAVIREGETGRSFFLVLRGKLGVSRAGKTVAELKQGDFFGEIALLSSLPRTATVTCSEDTLLLELEAEAFWRVLSENLPLAMSLEMVAEQRQAPRS